MKFDKSQKLWNKKILPAIVVDAYLKREVVDGNIVLLPQYDVVIDDHQYSPSRQLAYSQGRLMENEILYRTNMDLARNSKCTYYNLRTFTLTSTQWEIHTA